MKCFYHPDRDAAGLCPECGKAACHDCLKEVDGGILCKGCIAQRLKEVEGERQAAETDRQAVIDKARRRLRISKTVFLVFFALGVLTAVFLAVGSLFSTDPDAPGFFVAIIGGSLAAPIVGYYAWAFYWGVPAVWAFVRGLFQRIGCFVILNPLTWLIVLMVFLGILMTVGIFYCLFGGGWFIYRKHLKAAALASTE